MCAWIKVGRSAQSQGGEYLSNPCLPCWVPLLANLYFAGGGRWGRRWASASCAFRLVLYMFCHSCVGNIYIYKVLCLSVCVSVCHTFVCPPGDKQFVCPPGDKHFSHTGEGGQTFFRLRGGKHFWTIFYFINCVWWYMILCSEIEKDTMLCNNLWYCCVIVYNSIW